MCVRLPMCVRLCVRAHVCVCVLPLRVESHQLSHVVADARFQHYTVLVGLPVKPRTHVSEGAHALSSEQALQLETPSRLTSKALKGASSHLPESSAASTEPPFSM